MLPSWKLEHYVEEDGVSPILLFISGLSVGLQAEAEALKELLLKSEDWIEPNQLTDHRNGVFELSGEHVRIFCKFTSDGRVVLIDGLLKSQDSQENALPDSIFRKADLI